MEMISLRYDPTEGIPKYAVHSLFKTLGIPFLENHPEHTAIEILYGENVLSNADFSIGIPRKKDPELQDISGEFTTGTHAIRFSEDIFRIYQEMLSGRYEKTVMQASPDERKKLIHTPFVDKTGSALLLALIYAASTLHIPLVQKSYWPEGKEFAVCLTHDVDEIKKTYQWITYPLRCMKNGSLHRLYLQGVSFHHKIKGREPYWTFEQVLHIERSKNVRSTFFFLQETGKVHLHDYKTWRHAGRRYKFSDKKIASCMQDMDLKGWEVGLHGSFHSFIDFETFKSEKEDLQTVLGDRIWGVRQHNLNLRIPDTWIIQNKAGLAYDTTLGCNDSIGFRWGTCFPFRFCHNNAAEPMDLIEIPLIVEDTAYFRSKDPWKDFLEIADSVKNVHGIMTLLWHHSVFNEIEFPGWGPAYEQMIDFCLKKDAWITTAKEITQWWLNRESWDFSWGYSKNNGSMTVNPGAGERFFTVFLPPDLILDKSENTEVIKTGKNFVKIKIRTDTTAYPLSLTFSEGTYGS